MNVSIRIKSRLIMGAQSNPFRKIRRATMFQSESNLGLLWGFNQRYGIGVG